MGLNQTILVFKTIILTLFCIFSFTSNVIYSQTKEVHYIEIKEGYNLATINKTVNADETITLSMNNTDFANVLNNKPIYSFNKAYPTSQSARLQRIYLVETAVNTSFQDILQRVETQKCFLVENTTEEIFITDNLIPIPDDYEDLFIGDCNRELELINAPLAWTISTGANTLVGVVDSNVNNGHEDLNGVIIDNLIINQNNTTHGIGISGIIAANTNNGIGVSSLAHDSKIIFATAYGPPTPALFLINGLIQLSQYPNIKVINCSWVISANHPYKDDLDEAIVEVENNGVLVVAGAGNNHPTAYSYPASYDNTISVTSVGSKLNIGEGSLIKPGSNPPIYYWTRSWIDCHNIRPDSPNGGATHTHNDKVDVCAPGHLTTGITDNPLYPSGYVMANGTSGATAFVSALAALIFSVNPNLTPAEVKAIIKNTADDIYYIPYNQQYIGQLGTGRINAFRAVKTASCDLNHIVGLDLAMQNSKKDFFVEPDPNYALNQDYVFWDSDDIWVRNQNDGKIIQVQQNPEYDPNNPNYVYIRVTNNSCELSTGTEILSLNWAKANTELSWPQHWDGSYTVNNPATGQQVVFGGFVGEVFIPMLEPGESTILEIPWMVPNPIDFEGINYNPWHFCLLARIQAGDDLMSVPETSNLRDNILNNNNIILKNMTVVDILTTDASPQPIGGVVGISNTTNTAKTYDLVFKPKANEPGKALYEEAEIAITLDSIIYNAWDNGGKQLSNALQIKNNTIRATGGNATIKNITLAPGELGSLYISFNFLTKELTNKQKFTYYLVQKEANTNEVIGGETFLVKKQLRDSFSADAGSDGEVDKNNPITISAGTIAEDAVYNWYDPQGNLIHTGTDLTITPSMTQTYKLEVVSTIDGFKDYDEVQVTVNPYRIDNLVPNPAISQVTVNYLINGSSSAYLMVVNTQSGSSDNFILDPTSTNTSLDITNLTTGLYNIILVCDGEIQNSKTLIKQ